MTAYAVQLTAPGMGAIAVILLAGNGSGGVLRKILSANHSLPAIGKMRRVDVLDFRSGAILDDALLLCIAADRYELHIHGGTAMVAAILRSIRDAGATHVSLPEAVDGALLGPQIHVEATVALGSASTMTAARLLAAQPTAGLHQWATTWLARLPVTPLWRLHSAAQWLLTRSRTLDKLLRPARLAIVGPPNAGKSTLANALLGRPVAITSSIPGTTRDWVGALATFTHHDVQAPIILIDTAGVRATTDPLEQTSIARTHQQAAEADLLLLLFDGSSPPAPDDLTLLSTFDNTRMLVVASKSDLGTAGAAILRQHAPVITLSGKDERTLAPLMAAVLTKLDLAHIVTTEPFAFAPRQQACIAALKDAAAPAAAILLQQLVAAPASA